MKHIYQIERMEEYLPKEFCFGRSGMVQSFLDSMNSVLFPQSHSNNLKKTVRPIELKYINAIRDMTLANMKEEHTQKLLRKFSRYIIDILINDNYKKKKPDMIYYLEICYGMKYKSLSLEFHGYGIDTGLNKIEHKIDKNNIELLEKEDNIYKRLNNKQVNKFDKYCYEIIQIMNNLEPVKNDSYQIFFAEMHTYFSENGYIELKFS